MIFLIHLVQQLDTERPSWRDDTVLLLDGARYHTGSKVREYMRKLELEVIWSAPYSYSTAPIETVFATLKFGELNPDKQPTGKKVSCTYSISHIVVSSSYSEYGWCKAQIDSQEHLRPVLAPHDTAALQVPLLRAHLRGYHVMGTATSKDIAIHDVSHRNSDTIFVIAFFGLYVILHYRCIFDKLMNLGYQTTLLHLYFIVFLIIHHTGTTTDRYQPTLYCN